MDLRRPDAERTIYGLSFGPMAVAAAMSSNLLEPISRVLAPIICVQIHLASLGNR